MQAVDIAEVWMGGAEGQNRTVDTSLFRAVLCQLSYLGTGDTITTLFLTCQDGVTVSKTAAI